MLVSILLKMFLRLSLLSRYWFATTTVDGSVSDWLLTEMVETVTVPTQRNTITSQRQYTTCAMLLSVFFDRVHDCIWLRSAVFGCLNTIYPLISTLLAIGLLQPLWFSICFRYAINGWRSMTKSKVRGLYTARISKLNEFLKSYALVLCVNNSCIVFYLLSK